MGDNFFDKKENGGPKSGEKCRKYRSSDKIFTRDE